MTHPAPSIDRNPTNGLLEPLFGTGEAGNFMNTELNYDWQKCADGFPTIGIIVWVSAGGGTCLLAQWDYYKWISATGLRSLPFHPIYWQHLRLPDAPKE